METKNENAVKNALITGATSGFGYEFAKLFAREGYSLVLVARSSEALEKICEEMHETYRAEARPIVQDLFDPNAAERIYEQTKSWGLQIDVLVNNAGQGEYGKFADYDFHRDVDLIQLNITSLLGLTKFFLKDMIARDDGKILQIGSIFSEFPGPLMAVYSSTKAFVVSFTEALANELKDTNVTVSALIPGASDTDFFHKAKAVNTVTYREKNLSSPETIAADGYNALMKNKVKYISGTKNKIQKFAGSIIPDSVLASIIRARMSPSYKDRNREIQHPASRKERNRIEESIGNPEGDYNKHQGHVHQLMEKNVKSKAKVRSRSR